MADAPKFDPAALGLTVETAGYRPASLETGEADTTHPIGYSKALPGGYTQHYGPNGEDLGVSKDKSTWDSVKPLVVMAGSALLPGVFNGVLGQGGLGLSGLGLAGATGAATGATVAGVTGGDPLRGALMGGLGGAASNAVGQYLGGGTYINDTSIGDHGGSAYVPDPYTNDITIGDHGGSAIAQPEVYTNDTTIGDHGGSSGALTQTGSQSGDPASLETGRDVRGYDGEPTSGTGSNTSDAFPNGTPSVDVQKTVWEKLGDKVMSKFIDPKTGDINWSAALAAAGIATSVIGKLTASDPPPVKTVDELMKQVKPVGFDGPLGALTKVVPWHQRARIYAADMPTPIVAGRRYADGGEVEGALTFAAPFAGFVQGEGGGQDDLIDANLSAGEYVFDAESVSMLGDGNNEEGARKLDELRQALRAHKRSAPNNEIAPPAQGALSYMNGGQ